MAKGNIVLGQMLALIEPVLFDNLATQYQVNKGVRKMTARAHFAVMLFAQLAGLPSLRQIEQATVALTPVQRRCGIRQTPRSTLAEANLRVPWMFYRDLFYSLFATVKDQFPRHTFDVPGKLFSLDSTVIPLCQTLFGWAEYRTRKGGMKLHTQLDHDGYIPSVIRVTAARGHDMPQGRKFRFHPGDTVLFDKGYFDSAWFYQLCNQGVFFVTRIKRNIGFGYEERRHCDRKAGVRRDWIGYLDGDCGVNCPEPLRLIRFVDPETGNDLEFLTNLLDVDALVIADLYRERWQIELFFKWIKQNLKIKTYLGTDMNAVLIQVWIAMIAYLMVRIIEQQAPNQAITAHRLMVFLAVHALMQTPINHAWQESQRTKRKRNMADTTSARKMIC